MFENVKLNEFLMCLLQITSSAFCEDLAEQLRNDSEYLEHFESKLAKWTSYLEMCKEDSCTKTLGEFEGTTIQAMIRHDAEQFKNKQRVATSVKNGFARLSGRDVPTKIDKIRDDDDCR